MLRICGCKREQVTEGWRKLHNMELHKFLLCVKNPYGDEIKEDDVGEHVALMWEMKNMYKVLVGKP